MNKKLIATLLGVSGALLWFMPLVNVEFMGQHMHRTGQHIGGIAYLILLAALAYTALSWMQQNVPRSIASGLAAAICGLFLFQARADAAWGLYALLLVNVGCLTLAVLDNMATVAVADGVRA